MTSLPESTRAASYCRVSTDRQAETGLSLEAQRRRCQDEAAARGAALVAEYIERGVSGKHESRPELDRLRADAKAGRFDVLIVPALDRLGRSARNLHNLHHELRQLGIELVFINERIDSSTPMGRAQLGMLAVFAEFEREMISERVRSVNAGRAGEGKHHGRAPLGYKSENGFLIVELEEASIVERIFGEYVAGRSQQAITRDLNREGIRTKHGGVWHQGTASKVLGNRIYLGEVQHGGEWRDGRHQAIIDCETFDAAAALREAGQKSHGHRGRAPKHGHLLIRGMATCAHCGGSIVPRSDRDHAAYFCITRKTHGVSACVLPNLPRETIDAAIFDFFETSGLDTETMKARFESIVADRRHRAAAARQQAEDDALLASQRIQRVQRGWQDGVLSDDDYREQIASLREEHDGAQAAVKQARRQEDEIAKAAEFFLDAESELMTRLQVLRDAIVGRVRDAEGVEATRAALRSMFEFSIAIEGGEVDREDDDKISFMLVRNIPKKGRIYIRVCPKPGVIETFQATGDQLILKLKKMSLELGPVSSASTSDAETFAFASVIERVLFGQIAVGVES